MYGNRRRTRVHRAFLHGSKGRGKTESPSCRSCLLLALLVALFADRRVNSDPRARRPKESGRNLLLTDVADQCFTFSSISLVHPMQMSNDTL